MTGDAEQRRALDLAGRALSARDRTVAELRAHLERKRVGPAAIEGAIAELEESGYLDDARFARRFAEDRRQLDGWGRERIAMDLARRGVAHDLVDEALAGEDAEQELAAARELLGRRFPAGVAGDRERDRAWRLLVRRGYESELAYAAVRGHRAGARAGGEGANLSPPPASEGG